VRGLFRYETAADHWWACAEDHDGKRVNFTRERYVLTAIEPPFQDLPIEGASDHAPAYDPGPERAAG
jgi:hypothetical protein